MKPSPHMPLAISNTERLGLCIPLDALNEEWADNNHGQTLALLKERGGLSLGEAAAIIQRRRFKHMTSADALDVVRIYLVIP